MLKSDFLAKLEANKDKPIIIGMSDEGQVVYANIPGHWLFIDGENLVAVRKVTNRGTYGVAGIVQQIYPFAVYTAPIEFVNYVESFIEIAPGKIAEALEGLEPVGTSKSLADIETEIEGDSILKALSPRGNLNVSDVAPGTSYGRFTGSAISTSSEGLPKYMKEDL